MTVKTFILDLIKSFAIGTVLGVPFLYAFISVIHWGGEKFYIYLWIFVVIFQLFIITIFPTWIQPLFNKYTLLEDGLLKDQIEKLAIRTKFPLTKIYSVDGSTRSSHSNAYFFGLFKNKRIVIFDTLLKQCNNEEVLSILGHEIGHYTHNHFLINLIITEVYLFVDLFLFGNMIHNNDIYTSFGFYNTKPVIIGFILYSLIYSPVKHILGFAVNVLSRRNEYQADEFAAKLGYTTNLRSSLIKIYKENKSTLCPDPLYSKYHHTHPTLIERLEA